MTDSKDIKISIAMIAHNEAHNLPLSLGSVQWADEINVIDTSSTDNTAEVARSFGAKVFTEPNRSNLNINKNISIAKCKGQWVFVLDADEVIPYDLAGVIRKIVNDKNSADGYLIPRRNIVMGSWVKRGSQYPDHQLRLFRREKGHFPAEYNHERLQVDGKVKTLDTPFNHHTYPDLQTFIRKNTDFIEYEAHYHFSNGKRITTSSLIQKMLFSIPFRFFRRFILKGGFRDGVPGVALAWFDVQVNVLKLIRLWELQKRK